MQIPPQPGPAQEPKVKTGYRIACRYQIEVTVDEFGDVTLRQEHPLGDDNAVIVVAAKNVDRV